MQHYIEDTNLSIAWAKAFLQVMEPGISEITPLTISITGLNVDGLAENTEVRTHLDDHLKEEKQRSVQTVANTIFPRTFWNPKSGRAELFNKYIKNLEAIKDAEKRHNNRGLYFERMIAFGPKRINQLAHIIETYQKGNRRRSAFQASIFDPSKDHVHSRRLGFPCLQQVAFAPSGASKNHLTVTGFYATQHLFEKAYGNYLGLYNLGRFMAHEMNLELERVNCVASIAKRGNGSKNKHGRLVAMLRSIIKETSQYDTIKEFA